MMETSRRGSVGVARSAEALAATEELRRAIERIGLPDEAVRRAGWAVEDMRDELRRPDPDRDVMASRLWRLAEFLEDAGATPGGPPLIGPIAAIADFVGPLGTALVLRLG